MINGGAQVGRHSYLEALETLRLQTDEQRKLMEAKRAAMPALSAEQAEHAFARLSAIPPDALASFFQGCRLRKTGENPYWYVYGDPRGVPHPNDPEMSNAVQGLNLALQQFDRAQLDVRIAQLLGGRFSWEESHALFDEAESINGALFALTMLETLLTGAKIDAFYRSLDGTDIEVLDRENMLRLAERWRQLVDLTANDG